MFCCLEACRDFILLLPNHAQQIYSIIWPFFTFESREATAWAAIPPIQTPKMHQICDCVICHHNSLVESVFCSSRDNLTLTPENIFVNLSVYPTPLADCVTLRPLWMALSNPCPSLRPYRLADRLLQQATYPFYWPLDHFNRLKDLSAGL